MRSPWTEGVRLCHAWCSPWADDRAAWGSTQSEDDGHEPLGTTAEDVLAKALAAHATRATLSGIEPARALSQLAGLVVEHVDPGAEVPLITENSVFVLRERADDILDFTRPATAG